MDFPVTIALISPNKSIVLVNIIDKFVWINASIVVSENSLSDDKQLKRVVKALGNTKYVIGYGTLLGKNNAIIYQYL